MWQNFWHFICRIGVALRSRQWKNHLRDWHCLTSISQILSINFLPEIFSLSHSCFVFLNSSRTCVFVFLYRQATNYPFIYCMLVPELNFLPFLVCHTFLAHRSDDNEWPWLLHGAGYKINEDVLLFLESFSLKEFSFFIFFVRKGKAVELKGEAKLMWKSVEKNFLFQLKKISKLFQYKERKPKNSIQFRERTWFLKCRFLWFFLINGVFSSYWKNFC